LQYIFSRPMTRTIPVKSSLTQGDLDAICDLKDFFRKMLDSLYIVIDDDVFNSGIHIGASKPSVDDPAAIWVRNGVNPGISYKSGGAWRTSDGVPNGVVIILPPNAIIPSGYVQLSEDERTTMNLAVLSDGMYIKSQQT
ncbi:MAG: hypothetical protein ACRCWR_01795, partial [Saezia sp.]